MFDAFFYQPILNLMVLIYNLVPGHDLGITIILLTVVIKVILLPLSKKSIKSQKDLQNLQPKMDEIKKKYADKKEEMSREIMKLYKENKVNPLSSCLPVIIQLPFLYAVFKVFRVGFTEESLNMVYPFLSRPESINYISFGVDLSLRNVPIAVLAGLAQFWQGRMMSTKRPPIKTEGSKDEDMMAIMNKQMVYFMPLMTVFIGLSFPGGLALYWLTTTVLSGLQQLYIFKKKNKDEKSDFVEGQIVE